MQVVFKVSEELTQPDTKEFSKVYKHFASNTSAQTREKDEVSEDSKKTDMDSLLLIEIVNVILPQI